MYIQKICQFYKLLESLESVAVNLPIADSSTTITSVACMPTLLYEAGI